jgi:hypothetical protein
VAVVPCTSAIRALLAFSSAHDRAYNFLLKPTCCHFAQVIGVTSDPRITFPYITQNLCQHARVACGAPWFQNGNGITSLKAPST